jgi:hypothetical protein
MSFKTQKVNRGIHAMFERAEKIPTLYPYEDWAGAVVDRLNTLARENCNFKEVKCGDDVLAMVDKLIAHCDQSAFNQNAREPDYPDPHHDIGTHSILGRPRENL